VRAPPRPCRVARPLLVSALLLAGGRADGADSVLGVLALGVGLGLGGGDPATPARGRVRGVSGGLRLWLGLGSGSGSGERGEGVRSGRIRSGGRVRRGVWSGSEIGPGRVGSGQRVAPGARRWGDSEEGWPRVIAGSSQSGRIWTVASGAGASKPLNGLRLTKGRWSKKRRSPSGRLMFPRFLGVDVSTKAGQDHWRPG
jgi:hypothetical protein